MAGAHRGPSDKKEYRRSNPASPGGGRSAWCYPREVRAAGELYAKESTATSTSMFETLAAGAACGDGFEPASQLY